MPTEGHDKPCYYCQKPCNTFAGDPGQWPVGLCHQDEPGVVKWHHVNCVSMRLHILTTAVGSVVPGRFHEFANAKPFEKSLRLLLALHEYMKAGNGDSEAADKIRDEMDLPWGWHGGPKIEANLLTEPEKALLEMVSCALYADELSKKQMLEWFQQRR